MQAETATAQLKKEFQFTLSKLSHEIRNPIALINSELQLMASSHPELCSYQQWDSLMDNLEYIRELLNELSDFSHAGTISPVPVNPKEFLSTVLSCEKNTLEYLGITLETHLIRNASESIEHPKGKIIVCLRKCEKGICISIQDNGCGMTKEQVQTVFSPFVTYKDGGTGLGLAVTNEIITAHHGQIVIDSRPGYGSTFRIFLH